MDSFYIILPSNTPYEGNTTSKFTVRLPDTIELDSNWTVAISSIIYPTSFVKLGADQAQWVSIFWKNKQTHRYYIPSLSFKNITELESSLNKYFNKYVVEPTNYGTYKIYNPTNETIERKKRSPVPPSSTISTRTIYKEEMISQNKEAKKEGKPAKYTDEQILQAPSTTDTELIPDEAGLPVVPVKDKGPFTTIPPTEINKFFSFQYDSLIQKFRLVFSDERITRMEISEELSYTLGFQKRELSKNEIARYPPDYTAGGVKALYIYSPNFVENTIVGNENVPLLRVVNVSNSHGEMVESIYNTEHHHRLLSKRFSEINIEIRSFSGKLVKFIWGNVIIQLHFQRNLF